MQISLKILLAAVTLLAVFLSLVRISDVPNAAAFLFLAAWMLSPLLVTFGVLYVQVAGSPLRRRKRQMKGRDESRDGRA